MNKLIALLNNIVIEVEVHEFGEAQRLILLATEARNGLDVLGFSGGDDVCVSLLESVISCALHRPICEDVGLWTEDAMDIVALEAFD